MGRLKFSLRNLLLFTLSIALSLVVLREVNRRLNNLVLNPYRLESTADLLVAFMDEHARWPADWNELEVFAESGGHRVHGVRTFQELRENVTIDFSFEPKSIDLELPRNFRVIVANDGTLHGATHDPNTTIYQYLDRKRQPKN